MGLREEMIAANIRNWLVDLAIGAKARSKTMKFGVEEPEWKYTAKCWETGVVDGYPTVYIHDLVGLAKAAGLEIFHRDFIKTDYYYGDFSGEDFFIFNDVRFSNMILKEERK